MEKDFEEEKYEFCFNCKHWQMIDGSFDGGYGKCKKMNRMTILEQCCVCGEYEDKKKR